VHHTGKKEERRNAKNKSARRITNNNQVEEFKMTKDKTWEGTFQGNSAKSQVKRIGNFMCPCYHIKGEYWDKCCKYCRMHVPASEVPQKRRRSIWAI
jgi:hypothetical protein